ncbi:MAG: MFS transporter [Candidatus Thermoplasmatota archaeon]|nr:MFS transporter [Candidatus Thermoplasmatota archaeon]
MSLIEELDNAKLTPKHWKWTLIASMGDFLDAGMFGASGITLLAISSYLDFSGLQLGFPALITLMGSAFGALVFGKLGDKFGRKFIYQTDMIVYAFAAILLAMTGILPSRNLNLIWAMVFYGMIGIAVGADIPTSWSLIVEYSPKKVRAKLFTLTNVMWFVAVIVDLTVAIILYNTGMILFRTLWSLLGIIAVVSWILRKKLPESPRYDIMKGKMQSAEVTINSINSGNEKSTIHTNNVAFTKHNYKQLFATYSYVTLLAWFFYLVWGIPASTYGEFFPYIFNSLHIVSLRDVFAFEMISLVSAIVPGLLVFSIVADKKNIGKFPLYILSAGMCAASFYIFVYPPFLKNIPMLLSSFLLFGIGEGLGVWPVTRLFSIEHYPTSVRNSGQGLIYFSMRFETAIFGLFTPLIIGLNGIHVEYMGWIAGGLFTAGMIVMILLAIMEPKLIRTEGESIDRTSQDSFYN